MGTKVRLSFEISEYRLRASIEETPNRSVGHSPLHLMSKLKITKLRPTRWPLHGYQETSNPIAAQSKFVFDQIKRSGGFLFLVSTWRLLGYLGENRANALDESHL
jgi:hypothetical protein